MDYKPALNQDEDELDALSFRLPKPAQEADTATAQLKVEGKSGLVGRKGLG